MQGFSISWKKQSGFSNSKSHQKYDTQHCNFPLVYMFSAGQLHLLIHIHETVENIGLWFDTILPTF